ncbi:yciC [Symbiodinium sp. CCMP2592]|nr:yciC [Symbiodinium sp. CCMP2592]
MPQERREPFRRTCGSPVCAGQGHYTMCRDCAWGPCPRCGEAPGMDEVETESSLPYSATDSLSEVSEAVAAELSWRILRVLDTAMRPVTAIAVARQCGLQASKDVNPTLYRLETAGKVEKCWNDRQPLWQLASRAKPQPTQPMQGYRGSMLPDAMVPEEVRHSDNAMVKATDSPLVKNILTILAKEGVPLTAISVARRCGLERASDVNPTLYALLKESRQRQTTEGVGQLLAEQVELADVVVVNKIDLASEDELNTTLQVVEALNPKAGVCRTKFGQVAVSTVLPPVPNGLRVQLQGGGDGYSWTQTASEIHIRMPIPQHTRGKDIDWALGKRMLKLGLKSAPPVAAGQLEGLVKNVSETVFEIEGQGAERAVLLCLEKKLPGMWAGLWKDKLPACGHPTCNANCAQAEPTTGLTKAQDLARERFGLWSFSFTRRRPFSGVRLRKLLDAWPLPTTQDLRLKSDDSQEEEVLSFEPTLGCAQRRTLRAVLRSKGFCWLDTEPLRQHVWAHAGRRAVGRDVLL